MTEVMTSIASTTGSDYTIREIDQYHILREPLVLHTYAVRDGSLPLLRKQKSKSVALVFDLAKLAPYNLVDIEKSSDITTEIETLLNLLISDNRTIPKPAEIRSYLTVHTDMIHIILPVCSKINEKLNVSTQISLEVYKDPEVKDEYLVIYVRQTIYYENIMNIIDEIDDACEGLLYNKSGWLIITTDFKVPSDK